jgi:hypothetical protein
MLDPEQNPARPAAAQHPPLDLRHEERPRHEFEQAVFDEICEQLETGEDLTSICRSDPGKFLATIRLGNGAKPSKCGPRHRARSGAGLR